MALRRVILIGSLLFISNAVTAQVKDSVNNINKNDSFKNIPIEVPPKFPGGTNLFYQFIAKNLKYPKVAVKANQEGRVYLSFVIEKDGSVTEVTVIKGVSDEIDAEAIRILSSSPNWEPGYQNNRAVRVKYAVNINFTLNKRRGIF